MKKNGFTLIELLLVMAILGIMAAIIVPALQGQMKKNRQRQVAQTVSQTVTQDYPKTYVADVMGKVPGDVTKALGFPNSTIKLDKGREVWTYDGRTTLVLEGGKVTKQERAR